MLTDHQHDENSEQGQKTWNFTHRTDDTDLKTVEAGNLNSEIVEQDHPALQANDRSRGLYDQEAQHGTLFTFDHSFDLSDLDAKQWLVCVNF